MTEVLESRYITGLLPIGWILSQEPMFEDDNTQTYLSSIELYMYCIGCVHEWKSHQAYVMFIIWSVNKHMHMHIKVYKQRCHHCNLYGQLRWRSHVVIGMIRGIVDVWVENHTQNTNRKKIYVIHKTNDNSPYLKALLYKPYIIHIEPQCLHYKPALYEHELLADANTTLKEYDQSCYDVWGYGNTIKLQQCK